MLAGHPKMGKLNCLGKNTCHFQHTHAQKTTQTSTRACCLRLATAVLTLCAASPALVAAFACATKDTSATAKHARSFLSAKASSASRLPTALTATLVSPDSRSTRPAINAVLWAASSTALVLALVRGCVRLRGMDERREWRRCASDGHTHCAFPARFPPPRQS